MHQKEKRKKKKKKRNLFIRARSVALLEVHDTGATSCFRYVHLELSVPSNSVRYLSLKRGGVDRLPFCQAASLPLTFILKFENPFLNKLLHLRLTRYLFDLVVTSAFVFGQDAS